MWATTSKHFLKNNIKQWILEVQIVIYKGIFYLHGEDLRGNYLRI